MSKATWILEKWTKTSLVLRILGGLLIGLVLGLTLPQWKGIGVLGQLFVGALKAIAPILVAVLVAASIAKARSGLGLIFRNLVLCPMACSFFGVGNDIAMQAVAIGFIIGVVQDSMETALNSSGDVFFTATADYYDRAKRNTTNKTENNHEKGFWNHTAITSLCGNLVRVCCPDTQLPLESRAQGNRSRFLQDR